VVTGGAGLIGMHLINYLIDQGHDVISIDNYCNSTPEVINPKALAVKLDLLTDTEQLNELFITHKPEIVYHTACHPYEGLSQFIPCDVSANTYQITLNTLVASIKCKSMKRFVFFSSMARYGSGFYDPDIKQKRGPPFEEWFTPHPEDVYAVAKVAAEQVVQIMCDMHNIEWTVLIPHNVYGEASLMTLTDPYRGFIYIWINNILRNKPFYIYGDGEQERAPSYVGDSIIAIAKAGLDEGHHRHYYNIGARTPYSLNECAEVLRQVFTEITGVTPPPPVHVEGRPLEVKIAHCSTEKSEQQLGYTDTTSLKEGMSRVVRWAMSLAPNGAEPRYLPKYELTEKMPEAWRNRLN